MVKTPPPRPPFHHQSRQADGAKFKLLITSKALMCCRKSSLMCSLFTVNALKKKKKNWNYSLVHIRAAVIRANTRKGDQIRSSSVFTGPDGRVDLHFSFYLHTCINVPTQEATSSFLSVELESILIVILRKNDIFFFCTLFIPKIESNVVSWWSLPSLQKTKDTADT